VSRAARGHVRPGLASTQREVRIGAKQQQLLPSRWTPQMLCQRNGMTGTFLPRLEL
jgi:hypothetical protein